MEKTGMRISVYLLPCWIFTVSTLVWTPVQGKYQLISSDEPIIAVPGEDVTLPCYLDPEQDVQDWTVEWSLPDVRSDPSERQRRKDVVFLYRARRELSDMMIVSYIRRTSLFADGLKHGDMSLKIRNVTLEDGARYRCFSPALDGEAFVQLVVDPNLKASTTETFLLPTEPSTPDPQEMMTSGRSRLAVFIAFISVMVIIITLFAAHVLRQKRQKRNKNEATSSSLPCSTAAMC